MIPKNRPKHTPIECGTWDRNEIKNEILTWKRIQKTFLDVFMFDITCDISLKKLRNLAF